MTRLCDTWRYAVTLNHFASLKGWVYYRLCMKNREIKAGAVWATREQLATRYCVHPRTVDEWRKQGNLPAFKQGTRLIRFDLPACDLWIGKYRHAAKWEGFTK